MNFFIFIFILFFWRKLFCALMYTRDKTEGPNYLRKVTYNDEGVWVENVINLNVCTRQSEINTVKWSGIRILIVSKRDEVGVIYFEGRNLISI